ncbi:MAG: diaminopimelate epimerase [Deltaproteobacteria bacterium]|nr:diaminopimelate epimerase [Deltaproteobacteria bacterium]
MRFWKYHGTGNDFVLMEAMDGRPGWLTPDAVRKVCDRRFGVGADGILLIEKGKNAPHFMRVLNADGSEAEMCGNGIRCVAKHLRERMGVVGETVPIETLAGIKQCTLSIDGDGKVSGVLVGLGAPILERAKVPLAGSGDVLDLRVSALGRDFTGHGVSMGNPHFVIFEGLDEESARRYGSVLSTSPLFPMQANIEFAGQKGPDHYEVRVYERGVGLTLACGTGAGATAVAAVLTGRSQAGQVIRIDLPGGTLYLTVAHDMTEVALDGPAELVFEGELL